ncbi:unnamed protein product [Mesocestoides corti]|uniref:J domain-containing protein n=1 Tax=Mesocestoides corti TaxID=53468 RepID=A0A0R3U2F9_MESCO|nr:unnamed protein product [Mesocestoides corti]
MSNRLFTNYSGTYFHTSAFVQGTAEATGKKQCYYAVLGVTPTASQSEIRSAYYVKCKETHPDVQSANKPPVDPQLFLDVAEAYAVLVDPDLRRAYDASRNGFQAVASTDPSCSPMAENHFSCSPYGPKISFDRASEIFRSRQFRRSSAVNWRPPAPSNQTPRSTPQQTSTASGHRHSPEAVEYYYRWKSRSLRPLDFLLLAVPLSTLTFILIYYFG